MIIADLSCSGTEHGVLSCERNVFGISHCQEYEAAGIKCLGISHCMYRSVPDKRPWCLHNTLLAIILARMGAYLGYTCKFHIFV